MGNIKKAQIIYDNHEIIANNCIIVHIKFTYTCINIYA